MAAATTSESTMTSDELGHSSSQVPRLRSTAGSPSAPSGDSGSKRQSGQTSTETNYLSADSSNADQCTDTGVQLKKVLGLWHGVALIVGLLIGAGIFVSPTMVVQYTGSVGMSLTVWVATGIMSMMGGFCYAELGTMIPKNGGTYIYVLEIFGPVPAFLVLWTTYIVIEPSSTAIVALTFANYVLQPFFPGCFSPPYFTIRLIAAALICLMAYINCLGVKLGAIIQGVFTQTKVLALIVIIVAGVHHLAIGNTDHFRNPMEGTMWDVSSIATAFYSTLFSYSGWYSLNYVTQELKEPSKNLPRAIAISLTLVTVIYVLTNVAYYAVLTPAEILSSSAVAVTFGQRVMGVMGWIIAFFVACSTCGYINGAIFVDSRIVYSGAREGHFPHFLSFIQVDRCTPIPAIIYTVILPLVMLMAPDVGWLLTYSVSVDSVVTLIPVVGLLWLRYKEPDKPRPIKVWLGFPILYTILGMLVAVIPVIMRPMEIAFALAVVSIGLFVYCLILRNATKPKLITQALDKVSYVCQMVFLCTQETCKDVNHTSTVEVIQVPETINTTTTRDH
ncbi:Y+L amino acid transporter 2-like [Homarus americanus]|uniref:Y+L amino acid transporter 2-like n=1 Tax=Homarus americanus TaxID=6706 RepID=UPI001C438F50|nr:Y+L amino acid transporter 2-like [Homarus americanus]